MWDFFETVRHRHSVRKYQNDMPVESDKLHAVLEIAIAAPSAGDLQSYQIIVVRDPQQRQALCKAASQQAFIAEAPVCLVFCSEGRRSQQEFGDRGRTLYALQDATIAASYAQLAVVAAGLASTWVGNFDEPAVSKILDLGPELTPVAMVSVGYPAEVPEPTRRRRIEEVVQFRD
jgi:nitroreductase